MTWQILNQWPVYSLLALWGYIGVTEWMHRRKGRPS